MELTPLLRERLAAAYGADSVVVASDIRPAPAELGPGPYEKLDVTDVAALDKLVADYRIDTIVHLASLLSAVGEKNPSLAMKVNRGGAESVLEVAAARKCKVFAPSTIAAFGPSTPRDNTPDVTIQRPTTMYGLTKVYLELLGEYYHARFGVDFRSVRYPGIISYKALPGGGTTDYAVEIFYEALAKGAYTCFLKPDTRMPMMLMEDCLEGTYRLMTAPNAALTQRTYNMTGFSFTPAELAAAISAELRAQGKAPLAMTYAPDFRQAIADTWPRSLDDAPARRDWGWAPKYDLASMTREMLTQLAKRLAATTPAHKQ